MPHFGTVDSVISFLASSKDTESTYRFLCFLLSSQWTTFLLFDPLGLVADCHDINATTDYDTSQLAAIPPPIQPYPTPNGEVAEPLRITLSRSGSGSPSAKYSDQGKHLTLGTSHLTY